MRRLLNVARLEAEREGRTTIHTSPLSYTVDSASRIRDPRGMFGERLGALVSAVSVQDGPLRNLEVCVESCHLDISARVFSPYASGLAALVPDEMELGATVVDMGAGVTAIAVFAEGALVHGRTVPLGGLSITTDIARGLSTPIAHAERLKTLHGSALVAQNDDRDMVSVPQVGEEDADAETPVPRSMLTGIIRPRLEEILELVRDRLQTSGVESTSGRRVVLTGGASQLTGAREMAQRILNKQTRLGRPIRVQGLAEAIGGPAFATCAGLLGYARTAPVEAPVNAETGDSDSLRSPWMRWSQWFKDNL
ncbi:MAG: cell division protein FtsA [Alphaproteobacteria bacterium]|nr:cell division protein FtsA [Alphaproteobacteria bacterium]